MGFWKNKFDELAIFNADKDKTKYTDEYLAKMEKMQSEYSKKLAEWAKVEGYMILTNRV